MTVRALALVVSFILTAGFGVAAAQGPVQPVSDTPPARAAKPKFAPDERKTLDGRAAAIWKSPFSGKAPLVLFSHGFGGCETQSTFLTKALSEAGYYVVAVRHADANCATGAPSGAPQQPFEKPALWSSATYRERRDDIVAALDALRADPALKDAVDFGKIGLVGHSLGGYTVLGLAGAWPDWKIDGVRAAVALSPYCTPFVASGGLAAVSNVQFQGGTKDPWITPFVKEDGGCFDRAARPAMFVEFDGAGHFAWTDVNPAYQKAIVTYAQSFLDAKLIGGTPLNKKQPGVSEIRGK